MNKDKLISLIIRKETYKDTKAYLNELAAGKEVAAKVSAEAVRDILTTDYIAQAKLYAVRFLKDAFEKGNPIFIGLVESSILPILIGIAADEADDKSVTKYAGTSYTKSEELSKFKSILSSLFRIAKECVIKWGEWIPDPNRKFVSAAAELRKRNASMDFQFKYVRDENYQFFKESCQKNGVKIGSGAKASAVVPGPAQKMKGNPLVEKVVAALRLVEEAQSRQQFDKMQNDFNQALNNYLENEVEFKEDLVQRWFEQFQKKKGEVLKRIGSGQSKKSSVGQPIGVNPGSEKKSLAIESEKSKSSAQKSKEASKSKQQKPVIEKKVESNSQPVPESKSSMKVLPASLSLKPKEEVGKSQKQVTFNDNQSLPVRPPKQEEKQKKQIGAKIDNKAIANEVIKQQKSPKASKGPIIFDDLDQSVPKISEKQSPFQRSKPEIVQSKPIRPLGEESRSPKASEFSRSSKQVQESKSPKVSVDGSKAAKLPTYEVKISSAKKSNGQPQVFKGNILDEISMSKDSERVSFSEEDQSENSQAVPSKVEADDKFKKKSNLASIEEQNYSRFTQNPSGQSVPLVRSRKEDEKVSIANKLLQENKLLAEKLQKLERQAVSEREAKAAWGKERAKMERQLSMLRENESKMVKKLKGSVPIEDYNVLKDELEKSKSVHSKLFQENIRLRAQQNTLIENLNQTKQKLNNMNNQSLQQRSRVKVASQLSNENMLLERSNLTGKNIVPSPFQQQQLDQDYVRDLTNPANIHSWLSEGNIFLFKKSVLGLSEIFYRDEYLTMLSKSSVYTQNDRQFISLRFTFQFKSLKQVLPVARYKNCQEVDLWTKPIAGDELLYYQELVVRLHRNPLKILKGEMKIIEGLSIKFLLPFMYMNFLREEEFSEQQFQQIFTNKVEQLIKSKIVQLNSGIIKQPQDFKRVFRSGVVSSSKIRFCLSQGVSDCIFMGQIELLRNGKALVRMLPIPGSEQMTVKARELLQNLIFLIS